MKRWPLITWRLKVALGALTLWCNLSGCSPRMFASDPKTSSDGPGTNLSTTKPVDGVPYCEGGNRASTCLLGANCRVTESGCQVCQCLSVQ
jgi:hypothetical protein